MKHGILLFSAILVLTCSYASAKEHTPQNRIVISQEESLGLIRNVYLSVTNGVKNKCWTNADEIMQKTRLTLEQSGINVYTEPLVIISPFTTNLTISAGGIGVKGLCVGAISLWSEREAYNYFGNMTISTSGVNYFQSYVASDPNNLNSRFLSVVDGFVSKFAADVIQNRRVPKIARILKTIKNIKPPTVKEENVWLKNYYKTHKK